VPEDRAQEEMVRRLGREVRQLTARLNMLEGRASVKTSEIVESKGTPSSE
jgi:hypothetical protein